MATQGRLWRLKIKNAMGTWVTVAGAREESASVSNGSIDRSGKETDGFQHLLAKGKRSASLSLSGVAETGEGYQLIRAAVINNTLVEMRAEAIDETLEGTFHIGSWQQSAPHENAVSFSVSFNSAGPFTWDVN